MSEAPENRVRLAAVCENPACRTAFPSGMGIGIKSQHGSLAMQVGTHFAGPCPKCGGRGVIPAGEYVLTSTDAIFSPESHLDRDLFVRASHLIQAALDTGMSIDDVKLEVIKKVPLLAGLFDNAPADRKDFWEFLRSLLMLVQIVIAGYMATKQSRPSEIILPKDVIDAIRISRPLRVDPADSQRRIRKEKRERMRKLDRWKKGR